MRGMLGGLILGMALLPGWANALSIQSISELGCLAVDLTAPAGPDPADRNITVRADCGADTYWAANPDTVAEIAATLDGARLCLSVDFRKSLQGQGKTFNIFAAADCQKALIWEIRNGFIVAEVAATVYCLEMSASGDGQIYNAIARIGCSGEDTSVWTLQ